MFEKLYILVKNNAGMTVIDNPSIPAEQHEAIINDATSSIIEVLKNQMETGKLNDLIRYFMFSGIYSSSVVSGIINRFANKLNNFYGVEPGVALKTANALIRPVMQELVKQSKNEQNKEFRLSSFLSKLSGSQTDLNFIVNQMMIA